MFFLCFSVVKPRSFINVKETVRSPSWIRVTVSSGCPTSLVTAPKRRGCSSAPCLTCALTRQRSRNSQRKASLPSQGRPPRRSHRSSAPWPTVRPPLSPKRESSASSHMASVAYTQHREAFEVGVRAGMYHMYKRPARPKEPPAPVRPAVSAPVSSLLRGTIADTLLALRFVQPDIATVYNQPHSLPDVKFTSTGGARTVLAHSAIVKSGSPAFKAGKLQQARTPSDHYTSSNPQIRQPTPDSKCLWTRRCLPRSGRLTKV